MIIRPNSNITLYSGVDIVPGEQHLAFSNENQRNSYFQSHIAAQINDAQMVRKDGTLRLDTNDISPATAFSCNYLSFVNPSWGNKTFYGFIVDVDYLNNETIVVKWTLDEFESWRFDVVYQNMTIERQQVSQADYEKNPYDPSILEYRTAESLPVGKDIEKKYYDIPYDAVFLGEELCSHLGVNNTLGALFAFCDMDLNAKDSGYSGAASGKPSAKLYQYLTGITGINSSVSFSVMSPYLYKYFTDAGYRGFSRWNYDTSTWGEMMPMGSNRIIAPITYVYIEGAIAPTSESSDAEEYLADLLQWFVQNNLIESIIGIYPMTTGMALYSGAHNSNPFYVGIATAAGDRVRNKKLDLFPYTYYRLVAPNGDIKELKIENFHDAQVGATHCKVVAAFDMVDSPQLVVAPMNYEIDGISPHLTTANANTLESLVFSQFPTLPYTISGWESQRAAIANSIIANNTTEYGITQELEQLDVYKQYASAITSFGEAAGSTAGAGAGGLGSQLLGALTSIFSAGSSGVMTGAGGSVRQELLNNRWAQSEEAYDVALGKQDTAIDNNFKYAKSAYAQNKYFRSNGVGMSNFMDIAFCDVLFMRVKMQDEILEKYDEYFDRYGYASGAIGIPYVIRYMCGQTGPENSPVWAPDNTTYVKTVNCIVKNVPLPAAEAIAQMFNSGIRFFRPSV